MSDTFSILPAEAQLVAVLRKRIDSGVWAERIPGVVKLAAEFGVSRPMMRKALGILIGTGEVVMPGRRKSMRVAPRKTVVMRQGTLVVHNQVEKVSGGGTQILFRALEATMPAPFHLLRIDVGRPSDEIFETVSRSEAELIFLVDHSALLADRLTDSGRRVIALGVVGTPARTPSIAVSYESLIRGAFRRAFAAGHRRVCMPLWVRHEGATARLRTYIAEEYERAGLRHLPDFDAPRVETLTPAAMELCIRKLFAVTPPTAVIINDISQWFTVVSTLAKLRKRIPDDVSTILLTQFDELSSYTPSQSHFRFPVEEFIRRIRRLLRKDNWSAEDLPNHLEPGWVEGASLAVIKTSL